MLTPTESLSLKDIAAILRVSLRSVKSWVESGELRMLPCQNRISTAEFDRFIKSRSTHVISGARENPRPRGCCKECGRSIDDDSNRPFLYCSHECFIARRRRIDNLAARKRYQRMQDQLAAIQLTAATEELKCLLKSSDPKA